MNKKYRFGLIGLAVVWLVGLLVYYLHRSNFQILNPRGMVADQQRDLLIFTVLLGLGVVLPVFVLTFWIAWRYREGNTKAKYSPELDGNRAAEALWWGIPTAIIVVLSVITWRTSHSLDPHKPLSVPGQPLKVQVIALDWKWLFVYPDQDVASVNYLQFPVDRPVDFQITADAPMNSFWIPQLGSQIYAMPGMSTQLHLVADKAGDYRGSSANLSGAGFAGMQFTARASSNQAFNDWLKTVKASPDQLTASSYARLAKPSQNNPPTYYASIDPELYNEVVMKYMGPGH